MVYFDPEDSPATSTDVFFDTEPAALPPRASIASCAVSRVYPGTAPVTTTVRPCSVCSTVGPASAAGSSASTQPAACHFSTIARCQSTANHSVMDAASVGPMPSTADSSSSDADDSASTLGNARATSGATPLLMCRIDSATRNFAHGRVFAPSRLASSFLAFAFSTPALVVKKSDFARSSSVSANRSPSSSISPADSRASAAWKPRFSMSSAVRDATKNTRSRSWLGHERVLGQRRSLSPSFCSTSSVPQPGQCVGMTQAGRPSGRSASTGPRISGMTSPALRSTTVSPGRTSLRATSCALCSVAISTVEPATTTGSITP